MAFCINCGNKLNAGANYCPKCGQPVRTIPQQTNNQQQYIARPHDGSKNGANRTGRSKWGWVAGAFKLVNSIVGESDESSDDDSYD